MRPAHILHLGVKELRVLVRDPVLLVLIAYSFTFAIYMAATGMPETLNRATIAIVDEDHSALSARIAGAFYPPYFLPPTMITQSRMDARMDAGIDTFALDIPPDFQRDVLAGRTPTVQLNVDATRMTQAFTGSGDIQTIVRDEVQTFAQRYRSVAIPPVDLALRVRFNPTLNKSWFGAVMELVSQLTLLSMVLPGAALIREREHGTIEHLLAMPVTPFEIMMAKLWSMGLVVLAGSALALAFVVQGLLRVPIEGSVALFLTGAALFMFASTSMGMVLATVARSMPKFGLLLMLVLMPLEILSGSMTPRESMPELLQWVMLVAPTTQFVLLSQAVLFRGAGFSVVWPELLALAAIGSVLFGYALARFRQAIGTMA